MSLAKHCGSDGCPDYGARTAALRATITAYYDAGSCVSRATIGTCGELRYVDFSDGFHSRTDYFDSTGRQVAGEKTSDIGACDDGAHKAIAGTLPNCTLKPAEVLCPRPTE